MGFVELYESVHTPLVLILCTLGCLGHLVSIGILARMPNPTNVLLLSMSCSQMALCVNFLYSTLFKYGSQELCLQQLWSSYRWTVSLLLSVNFSVLVHLFSTFHLVALSIVRHLSLRNLEHMDSASSWFTYQKSTRCLVMIYAAGLLVCTPLYFQSEVVAADPPECVPSTMDIRGLPTAYRLAFSTNPLLQTLNFWLFGSICKLVPCSVLGLMTFGILRSLGRIRRMSARFKSVDRDRQHHRTTLIILAVSVMFIVVEFPQGLLAVAQSLTQVQIYTLGDVFDLLTLLNSCLIFALFCSMNSRLRSAFVENSRALYARFPLSSETFAKLGIRDVRGRWRVWFRRGASGSERLATADQNEEPATNMRKLSSLDEKDHHLLKEDSVVSSQAELDETIHV